MRFASAAAAILVAISATACLTSDPMPTCSGAAIPCGLEPDETSCTLQLGCIATAEACHGVATLCSSYFSDVSCNLATGCQWDSILTECTGFRSCSAQSSLGACIGVDGCTWTSFKCAGLPEDCDLMPDKASCSGQDGCTWK